MRRYLLITIFLLIGCSPNKTANQTQPHPTTIADTKLPYLDPNTITINGNIKFTDSYKNVAKLLGKPGKMVNGNDPNNGGNFDKHLNYCVFKNLVFEKHKDVLIFNKIEWLRSAKFYLQTPVIRLDGSTKFEAVEKLYHYEDATRGTDMDKRSTMFIPVAKGKKDAWWVLDFDAATGKLYRVTYWKIRK